MASIIGKLFKGKAEELDIILVASMDGKLVDLSTLEALSFSKKLWGEGFAIEPKEGTIVAPLSGTISEADEILGIVCIAADSGPEIMIHAGIQMEIYAEQLSAIISELESSTIKDNLILEVFAEAGQKVEAGDVIMKLNLDLMRGNGIPVVIPVVVTNYERYTMQFIEDKDAMEKDVVEIGKPVMRLKAIEK